MGKNSSLLLLLLRFISYRYRFCSSKRTTFVRKDPLLVSFFPQGLNPHLLTTCGGYIVAIWFLEMPPPHVLQTGQHGQFCRIHGRQPEFHRSHNSRPHDDFRRDGRVLRSYLCLLNYFFFAISHRSGTVAQVPTPKAWTDFRLFFKSI